MKSRYKGSILAWIFVAILVWGAIQYKSDPGFIACRARVTQPISNYITVKKHNIGFDFSPQRTPPLTTVKQEAALLSFLPGVFNDFGYQDWQEFWSVIYGPIEEQEDSFKVKRYRTKEEMERYLRSRYGEPFSSFSKDNWDAFWNIALSK